MLSGDFVYFIVRYYIVIANAGHKLGGSHARSTQTVVVVIVELWVNILLSLSTRPTSPIPLYNIYDDLHTIQIVLLIAYRLQL